MLIFCRFSVKNCRVSLVHERPGPECWTLLSDTIPKLDMHSRGGISDGSPCRVYQRHISYNDALTHFSHDFPPLAPLRGSGRSVATNTCTRIKTGVHGIATETTDLSAILFAMCKYIREIYCHKSIQRQLSLQIGPHRVSRDSHPSFKSRGTLSQPAISRRS